MFEKVSDDFFKQNNKAGISTKDLKKMDVGNMFKIPDVNRGAVFSMAKNIGIKIKTKKMDDGMVAVVRVA